MVSGCRHDDFISRFFGWSTHGIRYAAAARGGELAPAATEPHPRRTSMPNALARRIVLGSSLALLATAPSMASGLSAFQHGGRATGQAGAFTARAADPSAVTYNPA